MILQALHNNYQRLFEQNKIPAFGFSLENVGFAFEIDADGNLIQEWDIRKGEGKNIRPILMEIPYTNDVNVRANNIQPNFLVDKAAYLLGNDKKTKKERLEKSHEKFKALLQKVGENVSDNGLRAVHKFYTKWNPERASKVLKYWEDIAGDSAGFIVFRLSRERDYIHNHKEVRKAWVNYLKEHGTGIFGNCLITGGNTEIQRVHTQFKGIAGGQSSGKSIVSFNIKSAESYGKEQSYNAPVSIEAEFKSSTVLKYLIRSDTQRIYVGDAFTVFWTEKDSPIEGFMGMILDPKDDTADNADIRRFLEAVREGKNPHGIDADVKFYILGLSPNAARLSVRFWHVCSVGDMAERIGQHFRDLQIIRRHENDTEYPGIWQLLKETALKTENISPLLAGAVMRSILEGTAYPESLLSAVLNRIRADQNINYLRAAILKAILNRKYRIYKQGMEVSIMLDKENKNPAYLLGRLFAVLEKTQTDALGNINATIKDRFWGSVSATPKIVFPQLLKLAQSHIGKAEYGKIRDKQIEEIICDIKEFPSHLSLDEQGIFAIGYYHQRQDFYKKAEKPN